MIKQAEDEDFFGMEAQLYLGLITNKDISEIIT